MFLRTRDAAALACAPWMLCFGISKCRTPLPCNWLDLRQSSFLNRVEASNSSSVEKIRVKDSVWQLSSGWWRGHVAALPFMTRWYELSCLGRPGCPASIPNSGTASDEALLPALTTSTDRADAGTVIEVRGDTTQSADRRKQETRSYCPGTSEPPAWTVQSNAMTYGRGTGVGCGRGVGVPLTPGMPQYCTRSMPM